ncbi:MAG: peptidoglycan binding domain-containing protein [Clostridia bacterium]|nr:peptidoglycan binding domain-containing protein [Clostridia bacterium]
MEKIEKKDIKKDVEDIPSRKPKKIIEERDTSGDTKVFQIIRKEDIEDEKRRQAIIKENEKAIVKNAPEQQVKPEVTIEPELKTEEKKGKNGLKKFLVFLLILIILALAGTIFSTVFGLLSANSTTMIKGLKINNSDVSNMTKEQVYEKLQNDLTDNDTNIVIAKRGTYSKTIKLSDINGSFKIEDAVNRAYNVGRDGDIVRNNYTTLLTMIKGNNVEVQFSYNEEMLNKIINDISIDIPELATDVSYVIEGEKLIIKNSQKDIQITNQALYDILYNY